MFYNPQNKWKNGDKDNKKKTLTPILIVVNIIFKNKYSPKI